MILSEMFTGELIDDKFLEFVEVRAKDSIPEQISPCRAELRLGGRQWMTSSRT